MNTKLLPTGWAPQVALSVTLRLSYYRSALESETFARPHTSRRPEVRASGPLLSLPGLTLTPWDGAGEEAVALAQRRVAKALNGEQE